jgi:hypothetical protein
MLAMSLATVRVPFKHESVFSLPRASFGETMCALDGRFIPMEREAVLHRNADSFVDWISCSVCSWREIVQATTTLITDADVQGIFNPHRCENHPRCEVSGCSNGAIRGFRKAQDVSTSTTSGFIITSAMNWCTSHDPEMTQFYKGQYGDFVGPL